MRRKGHASRIWRMISICHTSTKPALSFTSMTGTSPRMAAMVDSKPERVSSSQSPMSSLWLQASMIRARCSSGVIFIAKEKAALIYSQRGLWLSCWFSGS